MVGGLPFPERKLTKFLIMFDNSNLLYFPGQFLSGRVIVELQEEMAITGAMLNTQYSSLLESLFQYVYNYLLKCLCWQPLPLNEQRK